MDHDFVATSAPGVPPAPNAPVVPTILRPNARVFPAQCGRLARQFIRMVFHE